MKQILLIGAVALSLCAQARTEKGATVENRTVAAFEKVISSGIHELQLAQGNADSVVVEVDAKWQKDVLVEVKDGTLMLWISPQMKSRRISCRVSVTCKNLTHMSVSEASNIVTKNAIKADNFDVRISNTANVAMMLDVNRCKMGVTKTQRVTLVGAAQELLLKNDGNGRLNTDNLEGKTYLVADYL